MIATALVLSGFILGVLTARRMYLPKIRAIRRELFDAPIPWDEA